MLKIKVQYVMVQIIVGQGDRANCVLADCVVPPLIASYHVTE